MNRLRAAPDWAEVTLHYPDGKRWEFRVDRPDAVVEIEREQIEDTFSAASTFRTFHPGPAHVKVELSGLLGKPTRGELDLSDPAVREMAEWNHRPHEMWDSAGKLISCHCETCGQTWPCTTRRELRREAA